mmetsp:Transcript_61343/g.142745  ORF Transcript_61343/g.142745 Transcript_61343/m.142745 type:complete len:262 (-) Transcript_61343:71-856(-)
MAKRMRPDAAGVESGTVVFNVGGRHYEVLRQTIRARPSTLLAQLIDDIDTDSAQPIFVDANPDRFAYVMDWYRYGEIHLPVGYPTKVILNDARFFLLPDFVLINGSAHALQPPFNRHAAATKMHHAVMEHWPTFEQCIANITAAVQNELEAVSERATMVQVDTISCMKDLAMDTLPTKSFTLSHSENKWEVWSDRNNVCNKERLMVLVSELRKRGFDCDVSLDASSHLTLNVGLKKEWGPLHAWHAIAGQPWARSSSRCER